MNSLRGFELSEWRLVITPPASGAWNMAIDEALLQSVYQGESPPLLRLYAWEPPCLSLGYAQPVADVNLELLHQKSWHLVRRPTGGRAILHTDELTYAVITPESEPRLAGGVLESYLRISTALVLALQHLDLSVQTKASKQEERSDQPPGPVCFEVPSNYEIVVAGKKLIGSAQARKKEGILQHGTLPLTGDLTRITRVLAYATEPERKSAASKLLERATTVKEVLGREVSWDAAAAAFIIGFQDGLNINFLEKPLSPKESDLANQLVQEKYGQSEWTNRA